jgi:hypothetical protein
MQRSLSLPGPAHASPRMYLDRLELQLHIIFRLLFVVMSIYTDFCVIQLSLLPLHRSPRAAQPLLPQKTKSFLRDSIAINLEALKGPRPHTKSPQTARGPEAVLDVHRLPLHLANMIMQNHR